VNGKGCEIASRRENPTNRGPNLVDSRESRDVVIAEKNQIKRTGIPPFYHQDGQTHTRDGVTSGGVGQAARSLGGKNSSGESKDVLLEGQPHY